MVTLHEVITFLVSMQISISSLQTHNVNRCGRSRHLARKLSLRRKRSSPNVFEMAATETITSRSEERRVGKECRCRWSPYDQKKKLKDNRETQDRRFEQVKPLRERKSAT